MCKLPLCTVDIFRSLGHIYICIFHVCGVVYVCVCLCVWYVGVVGVGIEKE